MQHLLDSEDTDSSWIIYSPQAQSSDVSSLARTRSTGDLIIPGTVRKLSEIGPQAVTFIVSRRDSRISYAVCQN